jgi:predicted glycosyl hydrolase (DUF1957 family)
MSRECFNFVLHTHLPYLREAGRWHQSQDMRHEAIPGTWAPLKSLSNVAHLDNLFPYVDEGLFADRELGP